MGYTLRVSVLDHCQLRCHYCLPQSSVNFLNKTHWLSLVQYEKIARALLPLLIETVRFTGGEPLLRSDLPSIIKVFRSVFFKQKIALTTNGLLFSSMAKDLISCGLNSVTFHLDTLREDRYQNIMGKGQVKTVLAAIDDAKRAQLTTKINVVVQKNINDDEMIDFLKLAKSLAVQVRFIELMNTGSAKSFVQQAFISGEEIIKRIAEHVPIKPVAREHKSAPAKLYLAEDLDIKFGLIASDTQPFCENCNRLRLSADGRLRVCLYEPHGCSLLKDAHKLPDDAELINNIKSIVSQKMSFHPLLNKERKDFSMSQIGG